MKEWQDNERKNEQRDELVNDEKEVVKSDEDIEKDKD